MRVWHLADEGENKLESSLYPYRKKNYIRLVFIAKLQVFQLNLSWKMENKV